MGLYDTFIADCPHCNTETQEQTKFLDDPSLRLFPVGVLIEDAPGHKYSIELNGCYHCGKTLYAHMHHQRFQGFREYNGNYPVLYSDKNRREGLAEEMRNLVRQLEADQRGSCFPSPPEDEPLPSAYERLANRVADLVFVKLRRKS